MWENWMIAEIIKLRKFDDRVKLMNKFIASMEVEE